MKKFFTFSFACLMAVAAMAQTSAFKKSSEVKLDDKAQVAAVSAAESEDLWGYYLGNGSDLEGLGTGSAGTFRVAIFVPGSGALSGAKISAVNLPVLSTNTTSVSVWGGTTLGSKAAFNKSVSSVVTGYNKVELDSEVEIPVSGLYVGYTFTISKATTSADQYPMAITGVEDIPGGLYLATSATGAMDDYSDQGFGVSGLQVYVTGMTLPANGLAVSSVSVDAAAMGSKSTLTLNVSSDSQNAIQSLGYTLMIGETQSTGNVTLSNPIPAGLLKRGSVEIEFDAPETVGTFESSIAINTVNGVANDVVADPTTFFINTVTRVAPRFTVIEEYTGTGCGYCPRGWVGMEGVKEQREESAIVIAWHRYNSSDPMYVANYASIKFSGAPQCCVDRKTFPDPYYGEGDEGILACVDKYNKAVPTVDITAEAAFDADKKNILVKSNTEFLTNVSGYTIAYVITADSLTGTASSWMQSNYYYQYTSAQAGVLPELPDLAKFCKNGTWGKSTVSLVFNDAMIANTYTSAGKSKVEAFTAEQQMAGNIAASEYTVAMPTKTALVNALNYEKVYANILVIDNNGFVANAKRVHVTGGEDTAISEVEESSEVSSQIYNLQGVRVNGTQADGIYVVNGKLILKK